jgi:hypothetical protein
MPTQPPIADLFSFSANLHVRLSPSNILHLIEL